MYLSEILVYCLVSITILWALRSPFVGLVGYYILSFLRPQDLYWYAFRDAHLSLYIGIATLLSVFFHFGFRKQILERINEFFWFFVLFFLLLVNSYVFSKDPVGSHPWFVLLSKLLLLAGLTMLIVNDIRQIRILIIMLVLCFGYLAIWANQQYFFEGVWRVDPPGRLGFATNLDNNGFAMQFVMTIPFVFFLFFTERSFWLKLIGAGLIPFMIHAIILTYSRGGFIGLIIVMVLCALFLRHRKWLIPAAIVLSIVVVRLQGQTHRERMETVRASEGGSHSDPAIQSRFMSWKAGRIMILENPATGVGIGNFTEYSQTYNPELPMPRSAHNAFLHMGGEMGIPALIAYVSVIPLAFYRLWLVRHFYKLAYKQTPHFYYATAITFSLVGFVICGLFLSLNYLEYFYFLIAMTAVLTNIYRSDRRKFRHKLMTEVT